MSHQFSQLRKRPQSKFGEEIELWLSLPTWVSDFIFDASFWNTAPQRPKLGQISKYMSSSVKIRERWAKCPSQNEVHCRSSSKYCIRFPTYCCISKLQRVKDSVELPVMEWGRAPGIGTYVTCSPSVCSQTRKSGFRVHKTSSLNLCRRLADRQRHGRSNNWKTPGRAARFYNDSML